MKQLTSRRRALSQNEKILAKYKGDTQKMHDVFEKESQRLAQLRQVVLVAEERLKSLQKEEVDVRKLVKKQNEELLNLDDKMADRKSLHVQIINEHSNAKNVFDELVKKSVAAEKELEKILIAISAAKKELLEVSDEVKTEGDRHSYLCGIIKEAEERLNESLKKREEMLEILSKREFELHEREDAVGKKHTEVTKLFGDLEVYVKRLQRFYNENHLNVDVLTHFNIKRDNVV